MFDSQMGNYLVTTGTVSNPRPLCKTEQNFEKITVLHRDKIVCNLVSKTITNEFDPH